MVDRIGWNLHKPASTALFYGQTRDDVLAPRKLTTAEWNQTVKGARKGRHVVVLYGRDGPIITEPLTGTTLKAVFGAIDRGLSRRLDSKDAELRTIVYTRIADWFRGPKRLELVKKFEHGTMTPRDLVGDHSFFEGGFSVDKGVLGYSLGS